jgi:hypothetical protein
MRTSNSEVIAQALERGCTVKFNDTDGTEMWLDGEGFWWFDLGSGTPVHFKMDDILGVEDVVGELQWEIVG